MASGKRSQRATGLHADELLTYEIEDLRIQIANLGDDDDDDTVGASIPEPQEPFVLGYRLEDNRIFYTTAWNIPVGSYEFVAHCKIVKVGGTEYRNRGRTVVISDIDEDQTTLECELGPFPVTRPIHVTRAKTKMLDGPPRKNPVDDDFVPDVPDDPERPPIAEIDPYDLAPPDVTDYSAVIQNVFIDPGDSTDTDDDTKNVRIRCEWVWAEWEPLDEDEGYKRLELWYQWTDESPDEFHHAKNIKHPKAVGRFLLPFHKRRAIRVFFVPVSIYGFERELGFTIDEDFSTTLAEDLDTTETVITVAADPGFAEGDVLRVGAEFVTIVSIAGTDITVEANGEGDRQAAYGSEVEEHTSGDAIGLIEASHPFVVVDMSSPRFGLGICQNPRLRRRLQGIRVRCDEIEEEQTERYLWYVALASENALPDDFPAWYQLYPLGLPDHPGYVIEPGGVVTPAIPGVSEEALLEDDFERADGTDIGTVFGEGFGNWELVSGQLKCTGFGSMGPIQAFATTDASQGGVGFSELDARIEFDIMAWSVANGRAGCYARVHSNTGGVQIQVFSTGTVTGRTFSSPNYGGSTTIATGMNVALPCHVRIDREGGSYTIYVNDVLAGTYVNANHSNRPNFAFCGFNDPFGQPSDHGATYDNFQMFSLDYEEGTPAVTTPSGVYVFRSKDNKKKIDVTDLEAAFPGIDTEELEMRCAAYIKRNFSARLSASTLGYHHTGPKCIPPPMTADLIVRNEPDGTGTNLDFLMPACFATPGETFADVDCDRVIFHFRDPDNPTTKKKKKRDFVEDETLTEETFETEWKRQGKVWEWWKTSYKNPYGKQVRTGSVLITLGAGTLGAEGGDTTGHSTGGTAPTPGLVTVTHTFTQVDPPAYPHYWTVEEKEDGALDSTYVEVFRETLTENEDLLVESPPDHVLTARVTPSQTGVSMVYRTSLYFLDSATPQTGGTPTTVVIPPAAENLPDLGDVAVAGLADRDILVSDGADWANEPFADLLAAFLAAGDNISFDVASGVITINGEAGGGGGGGSGGVAFCSADTANTSNTVLADAPGMSFAAAANALYAVDGFFVYDSAATTTGMQPTIEGPAGATLVILWTMTAGPFTNALQTVSGTVAGFTSSGATSGNIMQFRGWVETAGTAGDVKVRFKSEINSSAVTIKENGWMRYQ